MTHRPSRTELTGRTRRARIARSLGPEIVAGLASVLVVVLFAAFATRQPASDPTSPTLVAPTQITATDPLPTSSAVSPSTSPSPGRTPAPWAAQATALLGAEERLAAIRDRLVATMAESPLSANAIARELRAMNTTLTGALDAIQAMAASGAPAALVDDLRAAHEASLAVSLETLQASVQNVPAYQAGGTRIVSLLDAISALAVRVRTEAGLPSAAP